MCGQTLLFIVIANGAIQRKAMAVYDVLTNQLIYVFAITETWRTNALMTSAYERRLLLATLLPMLHVEGTSGGVAVFYLSQYKCATVNIPPAAMFESLCLTFTTTGGSFVLLTTRIPQDDQCILRRDHGCVGGVSTTAFSGHHWLRPQHSSA